MYVLISARGFNGVSATTPYFTVPGIAAVCRPTLIDKPLGTFRFRVAATCRAGHFLWSVLSRLVAGLTRVRPSACTQRITYTFPVDESMQLALLNEGR